MALWRFCPQILNQKSKFRQANLDKVKTILSKVLPSTQHASCFPPP